MEEANAWQRQGITPSDIASVMDKFGELGLDYKDAVFKFNYTLGRWEVFDASDLSKPIANNGDNWV